MSETQPKRVITRYLDALVAGDVETLRDSFAEDATWTVQADLPIKGPWQGRDEIINGFLGGVVGKLFEAGSHVFEFPTIMAEGDTVALEWRVQARNAAGEAYDNLYAGFFVVRDGKITTVREYLDSRYAAKLLFPELD
jgi:ketosteroid isomerase-like protein